VGGVRRRSCRISKAAVGTLPSWKRFLVAILSMASSLTATPFTGVGDAARLEKALELAVLAGRCRG